MSFNIGGLATEEVVVIDTLRCRTRNGLLASAELLASICRRNSTERQKCLRFVRQAKASGSSFDQTRAPCKARAQHAPVKGDLCSIVDTREVSSATVRDMRQRVVRLFTYTALGVPIAARLPCPAFGQKLSPMISLLAMGPSSLSVVTDAQALRQYQ